MTLNLIFFQSFHPTEWKIRFHYLLIYLSSIFGCVSSERITIHHTCTIIILMVPSPVDMIYCECCFNFEGWTQERRLDRPSASICNDFNTPFDIWQGGL